MTRDWAVILNCFSSLICSLFGFSNMTTYFNYPEPALQEELKKIANTIVTCGKGILAADESTGTMGKRLANIGIGKRLFL